MFISFNNYILLNNGIIFYNRIKKNKIYYLKCLYLNILFIMKFNKLIIYISIFKTQIINEFVKQE